MLLIYIRNPMRPRTPTTPKFTLHLIIFSCAWFLITLPNMHVMSSFVIQKKNNSICTKSNNINIYQTFSKYLPFITYFLIDILHYFFFWYVYCRKVIIRNYNVMTHQIYNFSLFFAFLILLKTWLFYGMNKIKRFFLESNAPNKLFLERKIFCER